MIIVSFYDSCSSLCAWNRKIQSKLEDVELRNEASLVKQDSQVGRCFSFESSLLKLRLQLEAKSLEISSIERLRKHTQRERRKSTAASQSSIELSN